MFIKLASNLQLQIFLFPFFHCPTVCRILIFWLGSQDDPADYIYLFVRTNPLTPVLPFLERASENYLQNQMAFKIANYWLLI